MWSLVLQKMLIEFVLDILYFPLWWYGEGAKKVFMGCINLIREGNMMMSPGLWLKNIFVPMFGQTDLQGRLVSFLMRFFNVVFRSIGLVIWIVFSLLLFLLWVVFPMFVLFMLVTSFVPII